MLRVPLEAHAAALIAAQREGLEQLTQLLCVFARSRIVPTLRRGNASGDAGASPPCEPAMASRRTLERGHDDDLGVDRQEMRAAIGRLDRLVDESGELIVTRRGKAIARILPVRPRKPRPGHADLRGRMPVLGAASDVVLVEAAVAGRRAAVAQLLQLAERVSARNQDLTDSPLAALPRD